jgi:2-dehydro-3-deoxygalactonokinase
MRGTYVCLDVGSTNSRAWLVRDGSVLGRETAAVGVRDSARDGSTDRVRATVRELIARFAGDAAPEAVLAAGMITSPLGLVEVPHLVAPASAADLSHGLVVCHAPDVCGDIPVLLVPGVRTDGAAQESSQAAGARGADVMRGEETMVVGLLASDVLRAGGAVLNAGSHWKLIRVDDQRRIAFSRTSLGGELVHTAQTGTILAASLPAGPLERIAPAWLEAGAEAGRQDGLLRALFEVRLLDQHRAAAPDERFSWLVGACIAEDIDALKSAALITAGTPIVVTGPAAIPAAWVHLLGRAGISATSLDAARVEQAFIAGLLEIVKQKNGV